MHLSSDGHSSPDQYAPLKRSAGPMRALSRTRVCPTAAGSKRCAPSSEKNAHGQVHLIRDPAIGIDGEAAQTSEFGSEQQIRPRAVHNVAQRAMVPSQNRAEVVFVSRKTPNITGK